MIRFIALDPGDVWCGYAMLEYDPEGLLDHRYFLTEARVFHVPSRRTLLDAVSDILYGLPAIVIAEDYAVRPVSFNRFSKGSTLRLLGALEFKTQQYLAQWNTVPAGPWERDLPKLSGNMFDIWTQDWYQPKRAAWGHAKSAWRVMFMYLMKCYPQVAMTLRSDECTAQYKRIRSVLYSTDRRTQTKDLASNAAKWHVPHHAYKHLQRLL
jgi:hypothetical protein